MNNKFIACLTLLRLGTAVLAQADPFDPARLYRPLPPALWQHSQLDAYPLRQLKLAGTLGNERRRVALFMDPAGKMHLLAPGQRLGKESWQIDTILHGKILLSDPQKRRTILHVRPEGS